MMSKTVPVDCRITGLIGSSFLAAIPDFVLRFGFLEAKTE